MDDFSPYPFGARRVWPLKASKMLDGGQHRLALFSCSAAKSARVAPETKSVHTA
jgi:hypothetical protein